MYLLPEERAILSGEIGSRGTRMAMEMVVQAGKMLGADRLVKIASAHVDGCLYHGASGTLYCEELVRQGARVSVSATTNVGALNLLKPDQSKLKGEARKMAYRLMVAHEKLGCIPSWTCAPYQTVARPKLRQQVAWGESNAVAFANTVLGARTNRYGDFLDICCAISGRAPYYGLHRPEKRLAEMVFDVGELPQTVLTSDIFFPVLGTLIGRQAGASVCAVYGLATKPGEDELKAFCAAAASSGAVALCHFVGITPEAADASAVINVNAPIETVKITEEMMAEALGSLSKHAGKNVDSIAVGSPHFSPDECRAVLNFAEGKRFQVPFYICTGRHTMYALHNEGTIRDLEALGVEFVVDTCVVVTPVLPTSGGVLMTNSAKFAHYALGNTGFSPVFGSLESCVRAAQSGKWHRSQLWGSAG